jgi:DUF4097 and DUF4098 domain-containing protein YvlB
MKRTSYTLLALSLAATAATAQAQSRIEERRPAAADGIVEIENAAGTIKVIGWGKEEVQVTGTLGARAHELDFVSRPRRTRIQVEVRGNPHRVSSDLEVRVPAASRIQIESYSAAIDVRDVTGRVKAESVSGSISIAGRPDEVDVESVSGAISVSGPAKRVHASGTNASVTIRGVSGVIDAESVNGVLDVSGSEFQEARLETVNGALRFDGGLIANASLDVETVNGSIELRLPASLGADFTISSYGGAVDSDFEVRLGPGPIRSSRRDRDRDDHDHGAKEMRFTTGGGGAKVSITTLNGRIALRKR